VTAVDGWQILEQAAEMSRRGESFALATVVWRQGPSSSQPGSRAIITADGEVRGWIGGACAEPSVIREAQHIISSGDSRLLLLGSPEQFGEALQDGMAVVPISCQSEGALAVYIEAVVPVPHLVVVGHSPMAHTLVMLATDLGWRADLIDGSDFTAADADERAMVVVATQGHHDEAVVERAVAAQPAYLGLVGSAKRGAGLLGYLADRGVPADQLDRVRVPAGLDLGSTTHPEIAVAVMAELVQLRAAGALSGIAGPAPAASGTDQASGAGQTARAQPTDPVCGMTVTGGPDGLRFEYEDRAYYFCSAGCQQAFRADPAKYVKKEARCLSKTGSR
jgi:xanthine dehydrogenase accessory factor